MVLGFGLLLREGFRPFAWVSRLPEPVAKQAF